MKRRRFLGSLSALMALGSEAAGTNAGTGAQRQAAPPGRAPSALSGRTTAPTTSYDVVVVGGGLAGVCAAIAAARHGATVALVTDRPVLGGNCSSECRTSPEGNGEFYPWAVATGLIKEIVTEDRLRNHEPLSDYRITSLWDLTLYEFVLRESPRLTLYLNTSVRAVDVERSRIRTAHAVQLSTEKAAALSAELFVDATGQGTLGALAGADFHYGRESKAAFGESFAQDREDTHAMGSTLFFRARDTGRDSPFRAPEWAARYPDESRFKARRHGDPNGGHWWMEIGAPFDTVADNEAIRHELVRHVLGFWDHVKNACVEVDRETVRTLALDLITPITYKREGRRLRGDHVITQQDLQDRRVFADRVAFGGWFIDLHETRGLLDENPEALAADPGRIDRLGVRPYSIPLAALYSRNIENLLMAGRTISTTHVAFGATRVQQTCAVLGQASGTAAALCVAHGVMPRRLQRERVGELQQVLLRDDFYVPFVANADPADLARETTVSASSEAALSTPEGTSWWPLEAPTCQIFPVSNDRLDSIRVRIRNGGAATSLNARLGYAADVWTPEGEGVLGSTAAAVPGGFDGWIALDFRVAMRPRSLLTLSLGAAPSVAWHLADVAVEGISAFTRPRQTWINLRQRKNRWCFRLEVTPESRPYRADNVLSGVARPERWTNIWISDPARGLPQVLELRWRSPQRIGRVHLTLDHSLAREHQDLPGFYVYPDCLRDYRIECEDGGGWRLLHAETGNVHRHRRHAFGPVHTPALRIVGLATNGTPSMRIYEVRAYEDAA